MARNAELLRKVGDHIAENPDSYDQKQWLRSSDTPCGTVGCVAGHAFRIGYADEDYTNTGSVIERGDKILYMDEEATILLGLDMDTAQVLFHPEWEPAFSLGTAPGERVRGALHALAEGASIAEVSEFDPEF